MFPSPTIAHRPHLERRAEIPAGSVFRFGSRLIRVHRVTGSDAAAPVIVEELSDGPAWLAGQFSIWSAGAVTTAMSRGTR